MRRILVALDRDDTYRSVFDRATELARATQANLNLLSILTPESDDSLTFSPYSDRDRAAYTERQRGAQTARLKLLAGLADEAKAAGIKTEFTQAIGRPSSAICKLAKTWEADLIVLGSRGRTGLSEILLGSVSSYVVHHAPCSVMVVRS